MPPAKRVATEATPKESFIKAGDLVNLVSGGRTLPNYEILDWDDRYIKFRGSLSVAPQTEIVLIPHEQIEAMGLVGQR